MQTQRTITLICTREPATGRTMVRPACELYRTLEQATRQVLRREYESGIMTYLYAVPILPTNWCHVDNVETRF
jgi:hypothetical protein